MEWEERAGGGGGGGGAEEGGGGVRGKRGRWPWLCDLLS